MDYVNFIYGCSIVMSGIAENLIRVYGLVLVLSIDVETHLCGVVETSGKVPVSNRFYLLLISFCPCAHA